MNAVSSSRSGRWRHALLPVAVLVLVGGSRPVVSQVPAAADWIAWSSTDTSQACVDSRVFASDLSRRLGDDAASVARRIGARLTVTITGPSQAVEPGRVARWSGEIVFASATGATVGRRSFHLDVASCPPVIEALLLAAAVYMTNPAPTPPPPELTSPPDPTERAPAVAAPPTAPTPAAAATPSVAASTASTAPPMTADRDRRWTLGALGGALVGTGDVPRGSWGIEASVLARYAAGPKLFLGASFWPEQRVLGNDGAGTAIRLVMARAGLCAFEVRWTSRAVAICPALEVGRLAAEGIGVDTAFAQERWRFAMDVGVVLTQRLSGAWTVGLEGRLVAPFNRNRITVADPAGNSSDLFRASPLGASGQLTIGYWPEWR
jgi:hypothetical protein